jgi:hypothetical protein
MVPKGLVAAVLAGIPLDRGIEGSPAIRDFAYMVILSSIAITAALVPLTHRRPLNSFYRLVFNNSPDAPLPQADTTRLSDVAAK